MVSATLGKWGNANAVRIPRAYCEQMGIEPGDPLVLYLDGENLIIGKGLHRYTLSERLKNWDNGRYWSPELDWGEPVGNEVW